MKLYFFPKQHSTAIASLACAAALMTGCKSKQPEQGDGAPPPAQVVSLSDMNLLTIDSSDVSKFPLVSAEKTESASELNATGTVSPDVSREVPVISLANGRVVDIRARLDDHVKKGELLFQVQSPDITNAFNAYLKAANDEQLASKADTRAKDLFSHGAISQAVLEQADDAESNAKSDLNATEEQLNIYGVSKDHPSSLVNVYAPISGVIVSQNITNAAATGASLAGSATAFTIADLSSLWVLCDVYENDIAKISVGQPARIKVNAYPDKPLLGHVSDIGPMLDPQLRTAKVRIQLDNPGFLKLGMFVTATFSSKKTEQYAVVPSTAVLHLHDREWVFLPASGNHFKRIEVHAGQMLPGNRQVILSGIDPGQQVVTNALQLETEGNQ